MFFDRELCFLFKDQIRDFDGGEAGCVIDLGAEGQFRGRESYVAIVCHEDLTATGSPEIKLSLRFSDDEAFIDPADVPLSLPALGKEDFKAGALVAARTPLYSKRYVKLVLECDTEVACSQMTAGIVLDLQTNGV